MFAPRVWAITRIAPTGGRIGRRGDVFAMPGAITRIARTNDIQSPNSSPPVDPASRLRLFFTRRIFRNDLHAGPALSVRGCRRGADGKEPRRRVGAFGVVAPYQRLSLLGPGCLPGYAQSPPRGFGDPSGRILCSPPGFGRSQGSPLRATGGWQSGLGRTRNTPKAIFCLPIRLLFAYNLRAEVSRERCWSAES